MKRDTLKMRRPAGDLSVRSERSPGRAKPVVKRGGSGMLQREIEDIVETGGSREGCHGVAR